MYVPTSNILKIILITSELPKRENETYYVTLLINNGIFVFNFKTFNICMFTLECPKRYELLVIG